MRCVGCESSVGSIEVVEVFPLLEPIVEEVGVVHDDTLEMAGFGFLVAFPPFRVAFVALGRGEPVDAESFEDPPHSRRTDRDVVIPLEIPGHLVRPKR